MKAVAPAEATVLSPEILTRDPRFDELERSLGLEPSRLSCLSLYQQHGSLAAMARATGFPIEELTEMLWEDHDIVTSRLSELDARGSGIAAFARELLERLEMEGIEAPALPSPLEEITTLIRLEAKEVRVIELLCEQKLTRRKVITALEMRTDDFIVFLRSTIKKIRKEIWTLALLLRSEVLISYVETVLTTLEENITASGGGEPETPLIDPQSLTSTELPEETEKIWRELSLSLRLTRVETQRFYLILAGLRNEQIMKLLKISQGAMSGSKNLIKQKIRKYLALITPAQKSVLLGIFPDMSELQEASG